MAHANPHLCLRRLQGDREEASNPAAPECSVSGCGCGPALMVASGLADIGLGSDHVSGIRVRFSPDILNGGNTCPIQFCFGLKKRLHCTRMVGPGSLSPNHAVITGLGWVGV